MFTIPTSALDEERVGSTDPADICQFAFNIRACVSFVSWPKVFIEDSGKKLKAIQVYHDLYETTAGLGRLHYRFKLGPLGTEPRITLIAPDALGRQAESVRRTIAAKLIKLQDMRWESFPEHRHRKFILGTPTMMPTPVETA